MKGKYDVIVQDKRIRFQFTVRRNITIVRGNSATGKTTLLEMIQSYQRDGIASGVEVQCAKPCVVLAADTWEFVVKQGGEAIFFVDECNRFITSEEFAKAARTASGYFVIITRDSLPNLPYSVEEIYGVRVSEKYAGLKKTYNEFFHLYGDYRTLLDERPKQVIVEDSNSGYEFYESVLDKGIPCISAQGKTKIRKLLVNQTGTILVIADGAAFGSEMERIMRLIQQGQKIVLYLPESFEWVILASDLLEDKECRELLQHPEDYIDSTQYFSWEQFFSKLLSEKTNGTYLHYQKRKLNPVYLQGKQREKILHTLPETVTSVCMLCQ